jgi:hypothetical protein
MAKTKVDSAVEVVSETLVLTPEEVAAIQKIREGGLVAPAQQNNQVGIDQLAQALVTAIEATRPPAKKTPANRKKGSPWHSDNKPKLRRVMYQHGIEINWDQISAEEVELLNKVKAGTYCEGFIRVIKRKDRSIDIDYPIKTASQRLRLINDFGLTNLKDICKRLIEEAADPKKFKGPDEDDDY